jgi:hypothetical protein
VRQIRRTISLPREGRRSPLDLPTMNKSLYQVIQAIYFRYENIPDRLDEKRKRYIEIKFGEG